MRLKKMALTALLSIAAVSCSSTTSTDNKAPSLAEVPKAAQTSTANNDAYYAVLEFDKGTQRLSEASKKDLREFVASAKREGREIDDIKILAWADREYPGKGVRLTDRDVKIATARSKSIEKFLKDDLKTSGDYETYNMAKRPNKVSEFFRGDDYKTKRIFERPGSETKGNEMQAFINNKASKALIMVDYKDE